ncbi:GAF domain-containing protein [Pseudoalteromonas sp. YIC-656]|uniref:GAF domain-containing protein n=1 Tax=Pseudoalteromonas pernae TaxID=3118054 RepID=UPI003242349B
MADLFELNLTLTNPKLRYTSKLNAIVKTAANCVPQADITSLWVCDEDTSAIICIARFDKHSDEFSSGGVISKESAQVYFDAIQKHDFLAIEQAREHPFTKDMNYEYFIPAGIHSLLDYVLHDNFKPKGVLCCEARTEVPKWQDDEKAVLKRIANSSSMFFDLSAYERECG